VNGAGGSARTAWRCVALAAVAAAFRLPLLAEPGRLIQDEGYSVPTAFQLLNGQPVTELTHPPTSRLLHAAGILLVGPGPVGWRLPSALAGVLLAPLYYLLARRVLRSDRAGLIAVALLLCDGLYLMFSRLATTNIFAVLFQVGAAGCLLAALPEPELPPRPMLAAGAFLGLALSTRWTSLPVAAFLFLTLLVVRRERLLRRRELLLVVLSLGILPLLVYVTSYAPWMAQGHSVLEVAQLQVKMWRRMASYGGDHPYTSPWYTWPWLYRPPLFHYEQAGAGPLRIILAIGNPAIWWLALPATLAALAFGVRNRDPRALFGAVGFCFTYLTWGIASRGLQYSHYFFESVPFACLSLAFFLDRAWEGRLGGLCKAYVVLAALLFVHFLPVLVALPIPNAWFHARLIGGVYPWRWFPSWY
jgi:dolichyl-phosphate-mannose--protein O-mannosyl transferase